MCDLKRSNSAAATMMGRSWLLLVHIGHLIVVHTLSPTLAEDVRPPVFCLRASLEDTTLCLEIPLQPPPLPGDRRALGGRFQRRGRVHSQSIGILRTPFAGQGAGRATHRDKPLNVPPEGYTIGPACRRGWHGTL